MVFRRFAKVTTPEAVPKKPDAVKSPEAGSRSSEYGLHLEPKIQGADMWRGVNWIWLPLLLAGFSISGNLLAEDATEPVKPFKRAMIFAGMGLDFSTYIGMYDAAVESGHPPDLIIATSGGSVAAAVISAFPDKEERLRHLEGENSFGYFSSVNVEQPRLAPFFSRFGRWYPRSLGIRPLTPDLFSSHLLSVPEPPENNRLNIPFPEGQQTPRVIVVGGRLDYPRANAPRKHAPLFTETWFTDEETGAYLHGMESPIARRFPKGTIARDAQVLTGVEIINASKASIAEPQLFTPALIQGDYYTGGAIDLWPVELGEALALEVILPRTMRFDGKQDIISKSTFGYSQRDRQEQLEHFPVAYRVDMSDNGEVLKQYSFWFTVDRVREEPMGSQARFTYPGKKYRIPRPRLIYTMTDDYEEFVERIRTQYAYGYERGIQAFGD